MSFGRYYHGDGKDQIGQVGLLLNGSGRYKVLWEDDRIKPGFGILSGISKESIKNIVNQPTLTGGRNNINGRQLLSKAKASIKEVKILLAYWTDFTKGGGFPSGKNEEDALLFVSESIAMEHQQNMEKEDDTDDDEEDDSPPVAQALALTQPLRTNKRVVDSDNDEAEVGGDNNESSDESSVEELVQKKKYISPALVTFMLLGPYGTAAYGFPISACFSIDTEAIEDNSKSGMYNTKSMKEEKKVVDDASR